jgi:hypothetical protein
MLIILATWEAEIRRIEVQGWPGKMVHETASPKVAREKWAGGVVQVVECLLCKHEALSSNSSTTQKKQEQHLGWDYGPMVEEYLPWFRGGGGECTRTCMHAHTQTPNEVT